VKYLLAYLQRFLFKYFQIVLLKIGYEMYLCTYNQLNNMHIIYVNKT